MVAGIASNVEESWMKYHRSNITCSARLRQILYDSDDIQFFIFMICEGSLEFSKVQVWDRPVKALTTIAPKDADGVNRANIWSQARLCLGVHYRNVG